MIPVFVDFLDALFETSLRQS